MDITIQNRQSFGTNFTPRFAKTLKEAIKRGEPIDRQVLSKNIEKLENDGKNIFFDITGDRFSIRMEDFPETSESLKELRSIADSETGKVLDEVISPSGDDLFLSAIGQGINKEQKTEGNAFIRLFKMLNKEDFVEKFNIACDKYKNALKAVHGPDFDILTQINRMVREEEPLLKKLMKYFTENNCALILGKHSHGDHYEKFTMPLYGIRVPRKSRSNYYDEDEINYFYGKSFSLPELLKMLAEKQ